MVEISGLTWAVTVGVVVALYALDLVLAMLRPHRVGPPEARAWSAFYIAVAVAFGAWLFIAHGFLYGIEYLVGYIVEKGLSTDNVFVFLIIMATFAAPEEHQHTVLTLGIMSRCSCARSSSPWVWTDLAVLVRVPDIRAAC